MPKGLKGAPPRPGHLLVKACGAVVGRMKRRRALNGPGATADSTPLFFSRFPSLVQSQERLKSWTNERQKQGHSPGFSDYSAAAAPLCQVPTQWFAIHIQIYSGDRALGRLNLIREFSQCLIS
ncbi:hypothetical protein AOLI_G00305070 [Acnodon oligacanthus]